MQILNYASKIAEINDSDPQLQNKSEILKIGSVKIFFRLFEVGWISENPEIPGFFVIDFRVLDQKLSRSSEIYEKFGKVFLIMLLQCQQHRPKLLKTETKTNLTFSKKIFFGFFDFFDVFGVILVPWRHFLLPMSQMHALGCFFPMSGPKTTPKTSKISKKRKNNFLGHGKLVLVSVFKSLGLCY